MSFMGARSLMSPGDSGRDLADHGFELGEVDGLGHVGGEPGFSAPLDVVFHSIARQGDRRDVAPRRATILSRINSRPVPSGRPMSLTIRVELAVAFHFSAASAIVPAVVDLVAEASSAIWP